MRSRPRSPTCVPVPWRDSADVTLIQSGCLAISAAKDQTRSAGWSIVNCARTSIMVLPYRKGSAHGGSAVTKRCEVAVSDGDPAEIGCDLGVPDEGLPLCRG